MELPNFKYHPDPIASGVIKKSDKACLCCNKARGYIYTGPVYAIKDLNESLCPWCIDSGAASEKFGASFSDSYPLLKKGIAKTIVEEVTRRTPGYESWQQELWLSHCNDACEFLGDASDDDVANASPETVSQWMKEYSLGEIEWKNIAESYIPKSDSAIYKFRCRHCGLILFGWDCS
jgi:uncharacterized protein CbrC (UPF0167 family)